MAYSFSCTGVVDVIKDLNCEDEFHIEVTFKELGSYRVSSRKNKKAFDSLRQMEVGQEAWVAVNRGGDHILVKPI